MRISYNWLKDLINVPLDVHQAADELTRVGLAVEGIESTADDAILDIDLTSNRPDCLSHLGIARELAAITGTAVEREPRRGGERLADAPFPSVLAADIVRIDASDLCRRFTARVVRNVKVGPSPDWLVARLEAVGERSINNVADITNYVMLELGQPMHAFDLDKLQERRLIVRRADEGETIETLDGAMRTLDRSMLAICDASRPVAVAGIIGGAHSSITSETVNVLLEVAYFDQENIRRTSRRLQVSTEASYRFERGVDIENLQRASDRAARLISELAGGDAREFVDIYPERVPATIVVSPRLPAAIERLTGLQVEPTDCERILTGLGFNANGDRYTAPSWRHDIAIEEDLVEEVARHTGYEKISEELPASRGAGRLQPSEMQKRSLRRSLAAVGFDEALSYSFIDRRFDAPIEPIPNFVQGVADENLVELRDSVVEGAVRMRPTLIPGLLDALRLNLNHQRRDVKLFEIGRAFARGQSGNLPIERELFAFLLTGGEVVGERGKAERPLDFYDASGCVEIAFNAIGASPVEVTAADVRHLRRGQSAALAVGGRIIGYVGRVNDEIATSYKFRQPVFVAEFDLEAALSAGGGTPAYHAAPRFPAVSRDVTFAVSSGATYAAVASAATRAGAKFFQSCRYVDFFNADAGQPGSGSLTVRFEYRSDERTLTEEDVNAAHERILATLGEKLDVRPRV